MNKPLLLIVTSALALSACHTNTSNNNAPAAQQGTQSGIDKSLIDASESTKTKTLTFGPTAVSAET